MKYFGCVLIMCGCIALSCYIEAREKNKIKNLGYMIDFIKYIENKINFFLTPRHILFSEYDNELIKSISKNNFKSLNLYFDKIISSDLSIFFNSFGQGLKDEQINQCKYTRGLLENARERAENELKNKIKVTRALILFLGATICILII